MDSDLHSMHCGLLGKTLGHSVSPEIHAALTHRYDYRLFEIPEDDLETFLRSDRFDGLNVTIPYKRAVIPYLSRLSHRARRIGAVNTILRLPDGSLAGDNTDYDGFLAMIRTLAPAEDPDSAVRGKKTLVLGSGGASATVCCVLADLGASSVTVISRSGEDNYENLDRHADAELIVNTTPVGMYPNNGVSPISLTKEDGSPRFPKLCGVADLIYNPLATDLILQAKALGIPAVNGLLMLVAQAKRAAELFTGQSIPDEETLRVTDLMQRQMRNLILIGMPGCGKSTVGKAVAERLHRPFFDTDSEICKRAGKTPAEIIRSEGEEAFRRVESEVVADLCKKTGIVLATGGGVVTRGENHAPMLANGKIIWILRDLSALDQTDRPLSQGDPAELFLRRKPLYQEFAHACVSNDTTPEEATEQVLEVFKTL